MSVHVCDLVFRPLILSFLIGKTYEIGTNKYTTAKGITCNKCPPGSRWVGDCVVDESNSRCTPCSPRTYQKYHNKSPFCNACSYDCKRTFIYIHGNAYISKPCSRTSDIECTCSSESYKFSTHGRHRCLPYTPCPPGQGVIEAGEFSIYLIYKCLVVLRFVPFPLRF